MGLVSNAIAYVGQGTGSIFSVYYVYRLGDVKAMGYGSLLNLPFMLALIIPALNNGLHDHSQKGFFFSDPFVYPLIILTTFINGFGQGIA